MKNFGVFVFFVACCSVYADNLFVGIQDAHSKLLFNLNVTKSGSFFFKNSKTVIFPPKGVTSKNIITAIQVIDKSPKGNGKASIGHGGIGYTNVTINLGSKRSQPLNFTVQVYGR